jgi:hypothetical protein
MEALREGLLALQIGNADPQVYAKPGIGLRFRFPFPDEDKLPLGDVGHTDFERGVLVTIERGSNFAMDGFPPLNSSYDVGSRSQPELKRRIPMLNPNNVFETVDIEIVQQKPVFIEGNFYLLLVYRCPYSGERWRIEHRETAGHITDQIRQRYLLTTEDAGQQAFWQKLTDRILKGYEPGAGLLKHQINKI